MQYVHQPERNEFTLLCSQNSEGFQELMPGIRFVTVKLYYCINLKPRTEHLATERFAALFNVKFPASHYKGITLLIITIISLEEGKFMVFIHLKPPALPSNYLRFAPFPISPLAFSFSANSLTRIHFNKAAWIAVTKYNA